MVTHAKGLTISGVSDPLFAVKADNEIIWHEKIQNYLDDDAVWVGREALRFTVRLLYDRELFIGEFTGMGVRYTREVNMDCADPTMLMEVVLRKFERVPKPDDKDSPHLDSSNVAVAGSEET